MDNNKENVKMSTKIPLPVEPLPALPKHLLVQKTILGDKTRRPLKTIMQSNSVPTTSHKVKKEPLHINTRHVTVRRKHENLDWDYKVFKDHRKSSIISISDDSDTNENNEVKFFDNNKDRNCLGDSRMVKTPTKTLLEPKGVRNIKRSLKRPHSRELQGLSPSHKYMRADDKVKRKLQFNEPLQDRLSSPDFLKTSYMACVTRDYADDMFEYLLSVEKKPLGVPRTPSVTRSCIINWLIKVNGSDGNPAIVQSACWYLDSILGTGNVELNKMQLVAAACFWIAQKVHGPVVSSKKLIKCSDNAFCAVRLMKAEKTVLVALNFPIQPVVPQEFITYLSWWCDHRHPGEIEVAATFLCLSGLMVDKVLCEEYPSVIAAASVRNALLLLGKRDLMMQLQSSPIYKAAEKKTANMSCICSILRRAVRTMSAFAYEYKAPLEHYSVPPYYIAQRIINAANELSVIDTRHISRKESFGCLRF